MNDDRTNGRILFIGDSITDADRAGDPLGTGHGYVRAIEGELRAEHFASQVLNRGIGGNRVRDLRERWATDALALKPDVVSILIGVNDTARAFDSGDETTAASFQRDYSEIIERTLESGTQRIFLLEPFLVRGVREHLSWEADLREKAAVVEELAERYGAHYVPLSSALNAAASAYGLPAIAPDGIHPTPSGHGLIAKEWLTAWRCDSGRDSSGRCGNLPFRMES